MKSSMRIFIAVVAFAIALSFAMSVAEAAEKKSSPFKNLVYKIFGFSKKTVQKEINAVGTGIKKGADVVVQEGKDVGALMKGDKSKAKDILVKPIKGAVEMVGETGHGVISAPLEAGKEVSEEDIK